MIINAGLNKQGKKLVSGANIFQFDSLGKGLYPFIFNSEEVNLCGYKLPDGRFLLEKVYTVLRSEWFGHSNLPVILFLSLTEKHPDDWVSDSIWSLEEVQRFISQNKRTELYEKLSVDQYALVAELVDRTWKNIDNSKILSICEEYIRRGVSLIDICIASFYDQTCLRFNANVEMILRVLAQRRRLSINQARKFGEYVLRDAPFYTVSVCDYVSSLLDERFKDCNQYRVMLHQFCERNDIRVEAKSEIQRYLNA